ncbi:MAG TPA: DUF4010 domain-containing protein [Nocardioides sp.]|nr:DUF4010 domain-containing protein [Nocardioides sp.]
MQLWLAAGVALAIGLVIGMERERTKATTGGPGVRTYAVAALLGCAGAQLGDVPVAAALLGVAVLASVFYLRASTHGLTSEIALVLTTALGALTVPHAALAAGLAVTTAVLLAAKHRIHRFVRETVTEVELQDALKLFVAAFIVLPLLPTGRFGPYGVWVPRHVWLLVVLIIAVGWVGYAATRALGASRGLVVAGLAGGFVSGTATVGAMGSRSRADGVPRSAAVAGALAASISTLVLMTALVSVADADVAARLVPAFAAAGVALAAQTWWLSRRTTAPADHIPTGRPFALVPALVLAAVISLVLLLATWMDHRFGAAGATTATVIGSLADAHASGVAVATLVHDGRIPADTAVTAIALGLAANTVAKVVAGVAAGGRRFAAAVLGGHVVPALAMAATLALT